MPVPGETEIQDGPEGVKIHITWGEEYGVHRIILECPPEMTEQKRIFYADALTQCMLDEGVNPFVDSTGGMFG